LNVSLGTAKKKQDNASQHSADMAMAQI